MLPHVFNIGFGKKWGTGPLYLVAGILLAGSIISKLLYPNWWAPPLGWTVIVFLVYFYLHLGLSFLLSSVLGTPGCEMRALPHLRSILSGKKTKEHFCPGFLDKVDKWERNRFQ